MAKNKNSNKKATAKKKKASGGVVWGTVAAVAVIVIACAVLAFGITGGFKTAPDDENTTLTSSNGESTALDSTKKADGKEDKTMIQENVKVAVEMENGGEFVLELYPEYAPQTVQNFVDLVTDGFYDGVGFHRVVEGFMAQGGDPEGTGMGGSGVEIPGEFASNGFTQNTLSHTRGVISMARSQNPDSASSQFFICYDDASFLDGNYAAFGKVIEGMDVVDAFLDVERSYNSMGELASPVEPITMKKVTIVEE